MAAGQKRNTLVYAQAKKALDQMKYEISKELNIDTSPIQGDYWGYMTARDCGAIGGHMVKRMIEAAERTLSQQAVANVQAGFRSGLAAQSNANDQNTTNPNLNLNTLNQHY
ncbi:MAG TPA: alpha/beta-type small acid-soluble spore protein [Firmicutes bacterium]|uniref:Alpha/beta-type small acid-soluble spore protein n=1 Tax=Capillibacterium thermochitinicola TaxID=2699427 RepID=A0A8J6LLW5_9FIRM|nr:alpha/beta-type small acid-soluble spore protein [Capillibacterium thermochitinicola]HHW11802.1 alpha/beta-type small acid-soluble spore protein [Bacillota bacterium]